MAQDISQQDLNIIRKYYAYKNENMPKDISDNILKEATEWHKDSQSLESGDKNKIEKDDQDKVKDFFNDKDAKNVSNDKNGNLCVKLKNNEQITYSNQGIDFGNGKKVSLETMQLALDGYAATGKKKLMSIDSQNPDFVAKCLATFEECGFKCKNEDEFKDNKEIQELRNKYRQEIKDKKAIKSKSQEHLSTAERLRRLRNRLAPAPQEIKAPLNPTTNKNVDFTKLKLMKDKIDGTKR